MRNFKEYEKDAPRQKENASAKDLTQKLAAAYNGKSNLSMLKSILEEAERSKRAGTLTNAEIDDFYNSFSPMLDASQRKRLRAVVEKLKSIE